MLVLLLEYIVQIVLTFVVLSLHRILLNLCDHGILVVFKYIIQSLPALFI